MSNPNDPLETLRNLQFGDIPKMKNVEEFVKFLNSKGIEVDDEQKKSIEDASNTMTELKNFLIDGSWDNTYKELGAKGFWKNMSRETLQVVEYFYKMGGRDVFYGGVQVGKDLTLELFRKHEAMRKESDEAIKNN